MILCLMSASYVIRAVVEEKDSRLVELLLVSVKPMALLAGKILAVMAFTFGWLLAMLAGLGVSCGLTAGLMGPVAGGGGAAGAAGVPGAGVSDHVPDRRRGRGLLLRHGGGR